MLSMATILVLKASTFVNTSIRSLRCHSIHHLMHKILHMSLFTFFLSFCEFHLLLYNILNLKKNRKIMLKISLLGSLIDDLKKLKDFFILQLRLINRKESIQIVLDDFNGDSINPLLLQKKSLEYKIMFTQYKLSCKILK